MQQEHPLSQACPEAPHVLQEQSPMMPVIDDYLNVKGFRCAGGLSFGTLGFFLDLRAMLKDGDIYKERGVEGSPFIGRQAGTGG